MDNLGYAAEEILAQFDLKEDLEGHPRWKRILRIVTLLLVGSTFLVFCAYQILLTIQSYQQPGWSSFIQNRDSTAFPGIILCPGNEELIGARVLSHSKCMFYDGLPTSNITPCYPTPIQMETMFVGPRNAMMSKPQQCLNYNANNTASSFSVNSFFIIYADVKQSNYTPHLLSQRSKGAQNQTLGDFPIFVQLYDVSTGLLTTELVPDFLLSIDSSNYVITSRTENQYLKGSMTADYSAVVSSNNNPQPGTQLMMWISFSTSRVSIWQQFVSYDVITVIGILAGALGFWRSGYTLINMIIDKVHAKYLKSHEPDPTESDVNGDSPMAGDERRNLLRKDVD